jgi:hypothetical protein
MTDWPRCPDCGDYALEGRPRSGMMVMTQYRDPNGVSEVYAGPTLITSTPPWFSRASSVSAVAAARICSSVIMCLITFLFVAVGLDHGQTTDKIRHCQVVGEPFGEHRGDQLGHG